MNKYLSVTVSILAILLTASVASAQNKGAITGKVVTEDGTPLANSMVYINRVGSSGKAQENADRGRSTETDDDGNFKFEGLAPRIYSVFIARAKAYVSQPIPTDLDIETNRFHKIGDNITLTLIRGGVITGRVINTENDPAINFRVTAVMVKDSFGSPVSPSTRGNKVTDDRGIYRIYGLSPGTYIINASNNRDGNISSIDSIPPTYHPSSTADTAIPVSITSGGEASGIDIQLRSNYGGSAVTGIVTGQNASSSESGNRQWMNQLVFLRNTATNVSQTTQVHSGEGANTFAFNNIPDGEYELTSAMGLSNYESIRLMASKIITVKGKDVSGIELRLIRGASIDGQVILEKSTSECKPIPKVVMEELLFGVYRSSAPEIITSGQFGMNTFSLEGNGTFTLNNLRFETYNFKHIVIPENLYIKSITIPGKTPRTTTDVSGTGVVLKHGDKVNNITITLSEGAASLQGKIASIKTEQEGGAMSFHLRVYLIPSDNTQADNVLLYAASRVQSDLTFTFKHIAPGKYWLITKPISEDETIDQSPNNIIRSAIERAKLRKEAEEKKQEIELKPCTKSNNFKISI